jgi:antitoxin VapB
LAIIATAPGRLARRLAQPGRGRVARLVAVANAAFPPAGAPCPGLIERVDPHPFVSRLMYIGHVDINIQRVVMALQIANPAVVSKVERLAKRTGLSKTAVVERAVDRLLGETASRSGQPSRIAALLAQLDRIPDRTDAADPLQWDEHGLPK